MPRTEKQPAEEVRANRSKLKYKKVDGDRWIIDTSHKLGSVRLMSDSSHLLFFTRFALRAFHRNAIVHTLTLGQALMPAGLSVEGRIMHHACDPRRAWLKNH